jgi:hypothetical protein
VSIDTERTRTTYVEMYVCTGNGRVDVNALVRNEAQAVKDLSGLRPAW